MPSDNIRLGLSFAGSLALNGLFLMPGVVVLFSSSPTQALAADAVHDSELPEVPQEEIDLGIDESDASTMTWIGYEDYMEHVARRAEFEQAQLQASLGERASGAPAPVQPSPTTPAPAAAQSTPTTTPPEAPTPAQEGPESTAPPVDVSSQAAGLPADPTAPDPRPAPADETPAPPVPGLEAPSDAPTPAGTQPDPKQTDASTPTPSEAPATPPAKPADLTSEQAPDQAPTPAEAPAKTPASPPAAEPVTPSPKPTDASSEPDAEAPPGKKGIDDAPLRPEGSDRDADATSYLKVTRRDLNLGRPQAHQGMKLLPRKPEFTSLRVVSSGGNRGVLARLVFNTTSRERSGRLLPAEAYIGREILEGKLKGTVKWFNEVEMMGPLEQTIHSSLFTWGAEGKKIDEITKDNPVIVNLDLQIAVK